jgi:hypothetical protein
MLSFDEGKPIAMAVDKNNKIVHIIKVKEETEKPDITVDNIFDILTEDDIDNVSKALKLSRIERKVLKKAMKMKTPERLNSKLKNAFETVIEVLNGKLKKELEFDKCLRVIPVLGYNETPFDRHIFVSGASGSGKSFLVGDLLRFDKRKRPIKLFSKVEEDKAFKHLFKKNKKNDECDIKFNGIETNEEKELAKANKKIPRIEHFVIKEEGDLLEIPTKEAISEEHDGIVVVFDDIDTFKPEISDFLREYQNDMLETGRHDKITVVSTSHELRGYGRTKKNLNEAEWVVLFPSSNQMLSTKFLKDSMGLLKKERENIVNKASKNRYMAVKTSTPLAVIHERGIILI